VTAVALPSTVVFVIVSDISPRRTNQMTVNVYVRMIAAHVYKSSFLPLKCAH
jgi:hypothetical protein